MSERAERLNALARKEKTEGLTAAEKAEQQRLREEFRAAFRENFAAQLDNPYVVAPEGKSQKLAKRQK